MFNEETFYTPQELQAMWEEEKRLLTQLLESKKEIAGRLIQGSLVLLPLLKISPQVRGISTLASIGNGLIKQASQKMTPYVGRKIAEMSTKGAVLGGATGGLEGLGRGLVEGENPFKTAGFDAVIGGLAGILLAPAQKIYKSSQLKMEDDIKKLRKLETKFYKDYNQGSRTYHKNIGDINFTQSGLETVSKDLEAGRDFSCLRSDIKNAKYVSYEKPHHDKHGRKDDIRGFHRLKFRDKEFFIADAPSGAKYYLSKKTGGPNGRPSRVESEPPKGMISLFNNKFNPTSQKTKSGRKPNPYPLGSEEYWQEEARRARFW